MAESLSEKRSRSQDAEKSDERGSWAYISRLRGGGVGGCGFFSDSKKPSPKGIEG